MTFEQHFVTRADGLRLGFRDYRPTEANVSAAPPVICLPGLTRNARDFHRIALQLRQSNANPRRVIAIDYRGRGTSDWAEDKATYNVVQECHDLLLLLDALKLSSATFIGTSRGGLVLHILAGMRPDIVGGIIFNDIGPELGVEGLREIQGYLRLKPAIGSPDDAAQHLQHVHGQAFPLLSQQDWLDYADCTYRRINGQWRTDCDPAIAEGFAALPLDAPLPDLWTQFDALPDVPMLVIRGENSKLLTVETAEEMRKRRPKLSVVTARGQGHAPILHLGGLAEAVASFL